MKKHIVFLLAICLIVSTLCACGKEAAPTVVTYEKDTTEATTQAPQTTAPETTEPASVTEPTGEAHTAFYEMTYSSARIQRDSVGNLWLNVMISLVNQSQETISLPYSTISIYADGEEVLQLEDVICYPQILEPGETGYYFEQCQVDLDENLELTAETSPNVERANDMKKYAVEDIQLRDSAFGVEVYGMYRTDEAVSGLMCAAVVLFDLEGKPFAVLSDYFDASAKEFILSSDKLPEGLRTTDISSYIAYVYPYAG